MSTRIVHSPFMYLHSSLKYITYTPHKKHSVHILSSATTNKNKTNDTCFCHTKIISIGCLHTYTCTTLCQRSYTTRGNRNRSSITMGCNLEELWTVIPHQQSVSIRITGRQRQTVAHLWVARKHNANGCICI